MEIVILEKSTFFLTLGKKIIKKRTIVLLCKYSRMKYGRGL